MSPTTFERSVSEEAFLAFAVPGHLNGTDLDVVLNRDLEYLDDDGNVRERGIGVDFLLSQIPAWTRGDEVTVHNEDTGEDETFVMGRRVIDDGHVVTVSVMEKSSA